MAKNISISFPLTEDNTGSYFKMNKVSTDDVKSSLMFFITSTKGERWYDPEFGTDLYKYLFEKNDDSNDENIKRSLTLDIEKYFKNLKISSIEFIQSEDEKRLDIFIFFVFNDNFYIYEDNIQLSF